MGKIMQKWGDLKPWVRYAIVGVVGLIAGALMATYGTAPM